METKVYVDVLLVINYIIGLLLIQCTAKLTGQRPKRRRIVAAALFGSASALTIFLPFFGFWVEFFLRLTLAAAMVLLAFPCPSFRLFGRQLFVFFAVSFFFSGVMLGVWMLFAPAGMLYYNGVVYFDLSSFTLIVTTIAAYGLLTIAGRIARAGRVKASVYQVTVRRGAAAVTLRGLMDTGNALYDPFSNTPVMVCSLKDAVPLLPRGAAEAIRRGEHLEGEFRRYGLPVRLIPYGAVGGGGMLPAFRPDRVILSAQGREISVEDVYLALSVKAIGGVDYNAILNPDMIGVKDKNLYVKAETTP